MTENSKSLTRSVEIVPAILRTTFEKIEEDWNKVVGIVEHIHIDVTDGIFAGDESFMDIPRLADLSDPQKTELHMMVQTPGDFVDDIIELNPARCIFHIEAFTGSLDLPFVYNTIGEYTSAEMGIAINPDTDSKYLKEYLPFMQFVLFMGYPAGFAGQELSPTVFEKIATFHTEHPHIAIAADGHIDITTIQQYAQAGATRFCVNTAIFKDGNAEENIKNLALLATAP